MGELQDGRYISDEAQAILDALMADAKAQFGEDLNDDETAVIRMFYTPVAIRLAEAQSDIGLILDSAQLEYAEGRALDLLTSLIGVSRYEAERAEGHAKVYLDSRDSVDHNVPAGTVVATNAEDSVRFRTTEGRTINGPDSRVDSDTYSTTATTYEGQTSFEVDVTYRDELDVSADIRTTDGTVAADLRIRDVTNDTTVHTDSTTNTSFTTSGPTTYDVSGLSGEIQVAYQIKSNDSTVSVEMTDATLDKQAEIAADCPIVAEEGGVEGNVGQNSITVFPDGKPFPGAEVTNPQQTSGGANRENDEELRARAQDELANGARATGPAIVSNVLAIDGVTDATIFINDTEETNGRGYNLPPHSFELVATTDGTDVTHQEIAQTLMDTKAVGDVSVTGENGDTLDTTKDFVTADGEIHTDLPNGQEHPVGFSLSTKVDIYVDVDITVTDAYEGDDDIRDSIVDYIGGWTTTGAEEDGELATGDDVIHSQVERAVMDVDGVYDINHVYIDTASPPSSTSNISLAGHEQAITDARSGDQHITMTTTQK